MHVHIAHKVSIHLVLVMTLGFMFVDSISGQRKPTALEEKTVNSPTNADYYRALASQYLANRDEKNRNKLITIAISQIDVNFREYQRKRRIGKDLFHLLADILEIGASTAVNIVNGARAKTIIGESLTLFQGARASADKNLRLLELQILFNKMIEKRSNVLAEILPKLELPESQYPFERAYIDIVAYFNAGTWDSALSSLSTDTGAAAEAALALLDAKRNAGLHIAPSSAEIAAAALNMKSITVMIESHKALETALATARKTEPIETAKISAAESREKSSFRNLTTVFQLIEGDAKLGPILRNISAKYVVSDPGLKANLDTTYQRIKNPAQISQVGDYELILTELGRQISDKMSSDSSLNSRLANILATLSLM